MNSSSSAFAIGVSVLAGAIRKRYAKLKTGSVEITAKLVGSCRQAIAHADHPFARGTGADQRTRDRHA
jgi:hypothetical protein